MMDLSDGLGSDLPKLAQESRCSFRIAPDSLPLHKGCTPKEGFSDGEDYELLVTIRPQLWPGIQSRWAKASPDLDLTPIGMMIPEGELATTLPKGYDHLRP
jgi:thiamine-monophosphate kinase